MRHRSRIRLAIRILASRSRPTLAPVRGRAPVRRRELWAGDVSRHRQHSPSSGSRVPRAHLIVTAITVQALTQAQAARTHKLSPSRISRIMARWRREGEAGLEARSRHPKTSPNAPDCDDRADREPTGEPIIPRPRRRTGDYRLAPATPPRRDRLARNDRPHPPLSQISCAPRVLMTATRT
jgi:hypothetical protein